MSADKLPPDGFVLGPGWVVTKHAGWCCTFRFPGDSAAECDLDGVYERADAGACLSHCRQMGAIVRVAKAEPATFAGVDVLTKTPLSTAPLVPSESPPAEQPSGNAGKLPPRNLLSDLCAELRESFRCVCDPETDEDEPCDCGGDGRDTPGGDGCWVCLANRYEEMASERPDPRDARIAALESRCLEYEAACKRFSDSEADALSRVAALEAELAEARFNIKAMAARNIELIKEVGETAADRDEWKRSRADVGLKFDLYRLRSTENSEVAKRIAAAVQAERERCMAWILDAPGRSGRNRLAALLESIKNGDPAP